MLTRRLLVTLGLIGTFCACGNEGATAPRASTIPTGVSWTLKCIRLASNERSCNDNGLDQQYTIRFDKNGTVSGTNACNTCVGTYSYLSATELRIHWNCTELACGTPAPWLGYAGEVANTTSFALTNDQLVLTILVQGDELSHLPLPLAAQRVSGGAYLEMVHERGD